MKIDGKNNIMTGSMIVKCSASNVFKLLIEYILNKKFRFFILINPVIILLFFNFLLIFLTIFLIIISINITINKFFNKFAIIFGEKGIEMLVSIIIIIIKLIINLLS